MSQEQNVEIAKQAIAAFNGRNSEALRAFFHPTAEIRPVRATLDGTVFRGPEAASEYCEAIDESWNDLWWELEGIRDGQDWVLALGRIRGSGRDSGVAIDARGGWLMRFRDGRISEFQTYSDRAEALKAVGLI
jgi:ketosteroid isomerase-like protein